MTTYADAVAAVRQARAERDAARDAVYALELRRLGLRRARERTARGEANEDPALRDAVRVLRREAAQATARRTQIEKDLESTRSLPSEIASIRERIGSAERDSATLMQTLSGLAASLRAVRKPAERDRLQAAVRDAQSRRAAAEESKRRDRRELATKEQQEQDARALDSTSRELDTRLTSIRDEIAAIEARSRNADLADANEKNEEVLTAQRRTLGTREADLRAAVESLYDGRTPQELLSEWDDGLPIVLLPLRVETRWKVDDVGGGASELWVRVYPDDVAVTTHERVLTNAEVEHGRAYWTAVQAAEGESSAESVAWSTLARRFGPNRAAWVALQTRPVNWAAASADATIALEFPEAPLTKPDAWTTAPHSRVLPDRFVLLAWRGAELRITQVGAPVDDVVILGPSPLEDLDGGAGISRDAVDQSLTLGESFRWVRDFDRAVQHGMAFRVSLSADDVAEEGGFDRLLVLGLKLSADAPDAQTLVEELVDGHHYSRAGFELLRQGTPTNNTDGADSGYSRDTSVASSVAESSPPAFTAVADRAAATDGQRLADLIGISYAPLLHVTGADHRDHAEAVAMNRALYAGTLGYYADHMLNEVVDDAWLAALRRHFTDLVTGRGPIAAIRVGSQPYGILPTSSVARWQPTQKRRSDDRIAVAVVSTADGAADPFEAALLHVLKRFDAAWSTLLPRVKQIGTPGNGAAHLLEVLGLHPTSAEFYQRVGYSYDYLKNLEQFAFEGSNFDDVLKMVFEGMAARHVLAQLGYQNRHDDGTFKPSPLLLQLIWRHYHTPLDAKQLIDGQPLSETTRVKPYDAAATRSYLDWLLDNAANAAALERQSFGAASRPGALLYLMLHFALVMEAGRGIHHWLGTRDVTSDELVRSRKFLNVGAEPTPSVWEVFRAPANRIVASELADRPLLEVIHAPQHAGDAGRGVQEQRAALEVLRTMPTARLERSLVEHIDSLSYRLDAWETSLFTRRLSGQRRLDAPPALRRTGVYLGAYGYLEHVRPALAQRQRVVESSRPRGVAASDDLFVESRGGGYVHAPSLNHATAAALLRSGYLTHATEADPNALAVNLSSGRVQRAKALLDGVRNGQSLEVLLGVQFERGLHDWTTRPVQRVILDHLKPIFRTAFPIRRTRVPQANDASQGASEVTEDYKVVNGLALARTTEAFPYGVTGLPALSPQQVSAIQSEKAALESSLDALRDLLTAESAYQLALGNFDRAAAVLQSAGNGTPPPDIQVLDTPRATEISFTQRLAVQLDHAAAANPWPAVPLSERARLEPSLNLWLGDLLGSPDTIACRVSALDAEGNVLIAGGAPVQSIVSLQDLRLQPIDFVFVVRNQVEEVGAAELETRVRHVFARRHDVADDVVVRIAFADAGGAAPARSFAEMLPLADRLRRVLGTARPLDARHFQSASKDAPPPADNPGRIETAELRARVGARLAAVRALFPTLQGAVTTALASGDLADIDALRDALVAVANAGVSYALPRSSVGAGVEQLDALGRQADAVLARATALGTATDAQLAKADAATAAEQKVEILTDAMKAWMGADTVLLPRFALHDATAVGQAHATRDDLISYVRNTLGVPLPVDEWLHGAACVRPRVHDFEMMRAMADAMRVDPLTLSPIQLPFRAGDRWLGAEFPPDTQVVHNTVSMVQHLPQGFDPAAARHCGLLIDEWVESVPARDTVTGIAFNFNAPNSAPPQALLLAVTPAETGRWQWDDLVDCVLDTFRRAKLRAIEPDMLGDLPGIGTLLPAVVAEFGTSAGSVSLDYSFMVTAIREPVLAMVSTTTSGGG
jgi:hypothetical protein